MARFGPKHEPLPDEYYREIGRVAVEWTKVEAAIETVIWAFLFVDDYAATSPWFKEQEGRAVTTHVNLLLRVDMMLSLASATFTAQGPELEMLDGLAKETRDLYPKRNKAVHGLWSPMGKMVFRQGFRARGDVSPFYDVLTIEHVKQVADDCVALNRKINDFIPELCDTLCLLRKRRR
jgi:hypothetical protein